MGQKIDLPSYAKLNLSLRIMGRYPDGFHEIRTLFERIDLYDELSFENDLSGKLSLTCDHPSVPSDGRNLVLKVAKMLQEEYSLKQGVKIKLKKNIPVAAGLAGGSTNAATALSGLNTLWKLGLSVKDLVGFGRRIGSDVPFFLYDQPWGLGTGRGDVIRPLDLDVRLWHVMITPKIPLLAKDVYAEYARLLSSAQRSNRGGYLSLTKKDDDDSILIRSLRNKDIMGAGVRVFNDLGSAIISLRPRLLKVKERLQKEQVLGVSFSGSGPSVFAVVKDEDDAERLRDRFSKTFQQVFVVRTR